MGEVVSAPVKLQGNLTVDGPFDIFEDDDGRMLVRLGDGHVIDPNGFIVQSRGGPLASAPDDIDCDALGKLAHAAAWPDSGAWENMSETARERWRLAGLVVYVDGRASRNADLDAAYRRAGVHMLASMRMRERALAAESALAKLREATDAGVPMREHTAGVLHALEKQRKNDANARQERGKRAHRLGPSQVAWADLGEDEQEAWRVVGDDAWANPGLRAGVDIMRLSTLANNELARRGR